jgi:hypothetical protein
MSVTEMPASARFARRLNSFVILRSKKRKHSTVTFLDLEKYPHRVAAFGTLVPVSLLMKEFDPDIVEYRPGADFEDPNGIPADQRAIDSCVPILCQYRKGSERWELCPEDDDDTPVEARRLRLLGEKASTIGAVADAFTAEDGHKVEQRYANCIILNAMIRGAAKEMYDCRREHEAIEDVCVRSGRTNLHELLQTLKHDPARVMSETARMIRDGALSVDLNRKPFTLVSPLELVSQ